MSSRALKPKPIEVAQEDNWIWGNNRGGGGAPLKDIGGTPVANLRSVIKGNAQVDYSPTRSPIKANSKHRAVSPEDDGYDRRPRRRDRDDSRERDRDRGRGREPHRSPDRARVQSPDLVRGLESHYEGGRNNARGIKDMHGVDPEKEARMRKELEYQAQLQEQIEEKKRRKEAEKRKEDEIKRLELEEYMSSQKGSFRNRAKQAEKQFEPSEPAARGSPSHGKSKKVSYADDRDSYESERDDHRHGGASRRTAGGRAGDPDDRYRGDDAADRGGGRARDRDPPRRGGYDEEVLSEDSNGDDYSGRSRPRNKRSVSDKTNDRSRSYGNGKKSGGRRDGEYVSQEEYDDLAAMYDDLKQEHSALREELLIQNELIQELKLQMKSKPEARGAAAPRADNRLREKAKVVKKSVAAFGGPVKPHKPLKEEGLAGNKQPKEDRRPNSMSTIERKGRGVEGLGLKLPRIEAQKAGANGRRLSEQSSPASRKPFVEERGGGGGGGGGLMGLLNKKGGGPIKVAYEADDGLEGRGLHSPVTTNRGASVELRGESEYMPIGGDEDHLGGAQLDRLLHQARNARVAPAAGPPAGGKKLPGGKVKKAVPPLRR